MSKDPCYAYYTPQVLSAKFTKKLIVSMMMETRGK